MAELFQVFGAIVMLVGSLTGIAIVSKVVLDRSKRASVLPGRLEDDRLRHLEQAVDAIALEVERISEAQRFTTKVLTERSKDSALR